MKVPVAAYALFACVVAVVPADMSARIADPDRGEAVERLLADLLTTPTATAVLTTRCGAGQTITVNKRHTGFVAPSLATRQRLGLVAQTELGYRSVELVCGDTVMSRAENWYVPERLTPAIRAALERSDIPFGRAIGPLGPVREPIDTRRSDGSDPDDVLRMVALVRGANGDVLAEVHETYTRAALARQVR